MNDQSSSNESFDRHAARQQRRAERRATLGTPSNGSTWIVGSILIVVGVAFLMQNLGMILLPLKNWWALFILIPAVGAFDTARRMYLSGDNQFNIRTRSSLLLGIMLTLVALGFLFDISWTFFGPVLIILVGIGILINATMK